MPKATPERFRTPRRSLPPLPTIAASESGDQSDISVSVHEADYDKNPTKLFVLVNKKRWDEALTHLKNKPSESSVWIYKTHTDTNNIRWRLLPLHAALVFKAPDPLIQALIQANPSGAGEPDDRGLTPLHLAFRHSSSDLVLYLLLQAAPESITKRDPKGRVPIQLIETTSNKSYNSIESSENASNAVVSTQSGFAYYVDLVRKKEREIMQREMEELLQQQVSNLQEAQQQKFQKEFHTFEQNLLARIQAEKEQVAHEWKLKSGSVAEALTIKHEKEKEVLKLNFNEKMQRIQLEEEFLKEELEQNFRVMLDTQKQEMETAMARQAEAMKQLEKERDDALAKTYLLENEIQTIYKASHQVQSGEAQDDVCLYLVGEKNALSLHEEPEEELGGEHELTDEIRKLKSQVCQLQQQLSQRDTCAASQANEINKENQQLEELDEARTAARLWEEQAKTLQDTLLEMIKVFENKEEIEPAQDDEVERDSLETKFDPEVQQASENSEESENIKDGIRQLQDDFIQTGVNQEFKDRQTEQIKKLEQERDEARAAATALDDNIKSLRAILQEMQAIDEVGKLFTGVMSTVAAERDSLQATLQKQLQVADELGEEIQNLKLQMNSLNKQNAEYEESQLRQIDTVKELVSERDKFCAALLESEKKFMALHETFKNIESSAVNKTTISNSQSNSSDHDLIQMQFEEQTECICKTREEGEHLKSEVLKLRTETEILSRNLDSIKIDHEKQLIFIRNLEEICMKNDENLARITKENQDLTLRNINLIRQNEQMSTIHMKELTKARLSLYRASEEKRAFFVGDHLHR